jgi:hypothetical protein
MFDKRIACLILLVNRTKSTESDAQKGEKDELEESSASGKAARNQQ